MRLTTNKKVSEMGMFELAHNSCCSKDGNAVYRDYEKETDARDFIRKTAVKFNIFEDGCAELIDDESFDETMMDYLQYGYGTKEGLLALFYRNLWAQADLYEALKSYEDLEERREILIVPQIPKNKTLYWIWGDEIMPVIFKRITSCVVDGNGKPHVVCEVVTKKDRTFTHTYRRKPIEHTFKKGDKRYFYSDDIGKTIFLTKEKAKAALQKINEEEEQA